MNLPASSMLLQRNQILSLNLSRLDQVITFSIQVGQKYCTDETFLAVSVLAALSCILVPE